MGKMIIYDSISFCANHVYAGYYDNHNHIDWFYDRLSNQYIQNAYDFHN